MNIYLVGFMGTGKTAVGKELARKKKLQFVDLDELIELKEKRAISAIFAKEGEPYFRKVEKRILKEVAGQKKFVVACGGGIVLDKDNIKIMKETGVMICLTASPKVICERTSACINRPLLNVKDPSKQIDLLLKMRAPYYAQADKTIDTSKISIKEAVDKIIKMVFAKKTAKTALILLFLIFSYIYCNAEDNGTTLLNNMIKKFQSLDSFSAQYEVIDYTNSEKSTLELFLQKPDKKREEIHFSSYDTISVSDGTTEWSYFGLTNSAIKSCKPKKASALICGLVPCRPVELPVESYGSEVFNGEDCYVLEQDFSKIFDNFPDKPKNFKGFRTRYWFAKDSGIPMKIQKYEATGELTSEVYILPGTYFANAPIPDEKFEYTPPEGATIVDYCKGEAN